VLAGSGSPRVNVVRVVSIEEGEGSSPLPLPPPSTPSPPPTHNTCTCTHTHTRMRGHQLGEQALGLYTPQTDTAVLRHRADSCLLKVRELQLVNSLQGMAKSS